ncbi:helix-turn-helix domain-containing protein [Komarekiella sp. 'clone 1']|uniref:Helix-turn-helix domain-containing protein n=1 Tax=Komarekiella delphini-convector SJRDD-AB1 TaxID=2593771 RepID=A0AA40T2U5_9NOST|nr:helix-turn-helix domain-containing protein [Komarekiella delphini-convector]MBD6619645.1 helix-turn-helix domain-containing protein [Komarekiella delphini-convector SJRDD-AB1]
MLRHNVSLDSVIPPNLEAQPIKELERILSVKGSQAKLVGANGEQITIPDSVYQVLHQAVHAMALGKAISIVTQERELTTQQAAEFLNVSRPYLVKLLEQGDIPYIKVGSHRRVRFDDLMNYKKQRDEKRSQLLQELIEISEEAGLYEDDE